MIDCNRPIIDRSVSQVFTLFRTALPVSLLFHRGYITSTEIHRRKSLFYRTTPNRPFRPTVAGRETSGARRTIKLDIPRTTTQRDTSGRVWVDRAVIGPKLKTQNGFFLLRLLRARLAGLCREKKRVDTVNFVSFGSRGCHEDRAGSTVNTTMTHETQSDEREVLRVCTSLERLVFVRLTRMSLRCTVRSLDNL